MKFLILAHLADRTALRSAAALRRRWDWRAVRLVPAESLAMAPRLVYTLDSDPLAQATKSHFEIELADATCLRSAEVGVVFNRLQQADPLHFSGASTEDREYAAAELSALWVSWLAGLAASGTPVINPVGNRGLQPGYSQGEWLELAVRAGFSICSLRQDSAAPAQSLETPSSQPARWLAAGEHLHRLDRASGLPGDAGLPPIRTERRAAYVPLPDAAFAGRVRRLQALSGCELLELSFSVPADHAEPYRLAAVEPFPQTGDPEAIDLIVRMLETAR